jgi:hypothetical protein
MERIKEELTKAGVPYACECLGGNIEGIRIGNQYIVEHGSGEGYYFGDLEDSEDTCYTFEEVIQLAKKREIIVAIVEVGEDYTDRLITIEADHCSLEEAQQIARDAGYQVIADLCDVVDTTDEIHIIVAVEPN